MNDLYAQIQSAANAGAFGVNGYALPTAEQCRAGNYRKGRVKLYGLDIAIETPQGQRRMGKSDGKPWSVVCMAHYGDISGSRGADGDPVDCYVGPSPESNRVFVVNQNGKDGAFDEHKVMLAFADEDAARAAYMGSYERGWTGLGSMVSATVEQFRWWLKFGDTTKPFSKNALPYDGDDDMTDITWDSAGMPANSDLATILYGLRLGDREDGLLLDAVQMSDILEDADSLDILDALVVENAKLGMKMEQLQRIMDATGETVKPISMQISEPFKQKGTTNVTALFELSDGQTVAIFFHNPDSTPNKILPQDELVSWKWLLNKKDVTILVAPEKGRDLNPREVARRIMRLAEKNSAKFQKANSARAERLAGIEQAKGAVAEKESTLASLDAEIADLTAKVEAKRVNQAPDPAAPLGVSATELATGSGSVVQESNSAIDYQQILTPAVLKELRDSVLAAQYDGNESARIDADRLVSLFAESLTPQQYRAFDANRAEAVLFEKLEEIERELIKPSRIDYDGQGAGTPIKGDDAFNRRYRHLQRQIQAAGGSLVGPDGYEIKMEDEGRAFYAVQRSAGAEQGVAASVDQRPAAVKAELAKLGWHIVKSSLPAQLELYGARYEIRPSVDEKAQTVTWKDTGGGPEWIDDLSLSDQAMAEKIDSEYRASVEAARAAAREPERHYSDVILDELVAVHGWKRTDSGSLSKDIGGADTAGELNPEGKRIVYATFDAAGRYLALKYGFDDVFEMDCRDLEPKEAAATFNARVAEWADAPKGNPAADRDAAIAKFAAELAPFLTDDEIATVRNGSVPRKILTDAEALGFGERRTNAALKDALDAELARAIAEGDTDLKGFEEIVLSELRKKPAAASIRDWFRVNSSEGVRWSAGGAIVDFANESPVIRGWESRKDASRDKDTPTVDADRIKPSNTGPVLEPVAIERGITKGRHAVYLESAKGDLAAVDLAYAQYFLSQYKDRAELRLGKLGAVGVFVGGEAVGVIAAMRSHKNIGRVLSKFKAGVRAPQAEAEQVPTEAAPEQAPAAAQSRADWQTAVTEALADSLEIPYSDADGVLDVHAGLLDEQYSKGSAPEDVAKMIEGMDVTGGVETDDPNIGRSWLNGFGETVSVESVRDGKYYTLVNGKVGGAPIIPVADLESTIALDERQYQDKLARERAAAEEEAQEAAAKAEREDTDGFAEQFPQVQRDRIRATLAGNRNTPKGVMSLRNFVRALVADGRVMSEWNGERILQDPATESFYGAKELTKTGLDYAAYLIARRPATESAADDQSQAARELLQSVIDGTADLDEGLTERLEAVHDQFQGDAEIMALFEQAANAFSDAMVAKAKAALA